MIKLRKRSSDNKSLRYYLLAKTSSASPDYVGLQVIYGSKSGRSITRFYWFKKQQLASGKILPARTLLQRKVRELVLRRLRTGYVVTRKCDEWGRFAVEKSIQRASKPKQVRSQPLLRPRIRVWERHQLSFDF